MEAIFLPIVYVIYIVLATLTKEKLKQFKRVS